jgi:glycosyltransferase 2 family protein
LRVVLEQIVGVDRLALLGAFLLLSAATLVAALRWSVILRALGSPRNIRVTYPLSLIGLFFGQALPAGVGGDVVRVWLGCKEGLSARVSISSVLGDRLTGLLSILLIVTAELPMIRRLLPGQAFFYTLLAILAAGYAGFAGLTILDKLPPRLHAFRIVRGFAGVSADLRTMLSRAGPAVLFFGIVIQACNIAAVAFLAAGLHLRADLLASLIVVPLANILQSLPISIAGWGVRESFFVAAFGMLAIGAPQAIALSVVFGLLIVVSSLPGGILWLFQGVGSLRGVRDVASVES